MRTSLLPFLIVLAACGPETAPITGAPSATRPTPDAQLTIYSQNVYVGTDVDAVLSAPPELLQARLFEALSLFAATNWPERAAAIADHIAARQPDLVALNEVSTVTVQGLAPFFPDLVVDFLPILMAALDARGGGYVIAGSVNNVDANLSLGGASIRLQDRDVVLARRDIGLANVQARNFAAGVVVPLGPLGSVSLVRGWVQLDATVGGRTVRFVATHLEPQETSLPLQLAQTGELLSVLDGSPLPVVIAGDLNSDPLDPSPMTSYTELAAAGFLDTWNDRAGSRHSTGFTCCTASSLQATTAGHHKRIDLVLARPVGRSRGQGLGPTRFDLFGDESSERTVSGLWPSDHAGINVSIPWRQLDGRLTNF